MTDSIAVDPRYWPGIRRVLLAFGISVFGVLLLEFVLIGGPVMVLEAILADDTAFQLSFLPRILPAFLVQVPLMAVLLISVMFVARLLKLRSVFTFSLATAALAGISVFAIAIIHSARIAAIYGSMGTTALVQSQGNDVQDGMMENLMFAGEFALYCFLVGMIFHFIAYRRPKVQEAA